MVECDPGVNCATIRGRVSRAATRGGPVGGAGWCASYDRSGSYGRSFRGISWAGRRQPAKWPETVDRGRTCLGGRCDPAGRLFRLTSRVLCFSFSDSDFIGQAICMASLANRGTVQAWTEMPAELLAGCTLAAA